MLTHNNFISNWHSHTFRCKHATGDAADYCETAVKAGLQAIGIMDHSPTRDNRWCGVRFEFSGIPDYTAAIDRAAAAYPQLKVFKGLECEWVPAFGRDYYETELRGKNGIEFIGGAPHSFYLSAEDDTHWYNSFLRSPTVDQKAWTVNYTKYVVDMISTGLFDFIAHPDLIGCFCTSWTDECTAAAKAIAQAARDARIPLEINTSGFRKPAVTDDDGTVRSQYPWIPFWQIAAVEGATAVINTDAHAPDLINASIDEAFDLVEKSGVKVIFPLKPEDFHLA